MVESFHDGRYTVVRELGRGGQKVVYLVRDSTLQRECALALIEHLDTAAAARLKHEAQSLARMGTHPNIVTVHDLGEQDGRPYLVSEFVPGGDLSAELERSGGPLLVERAIAVAEQLLDALAFIHERGIVHRDLKPSNVWITASGAVKLGDFGLALERDRARLTHSDTVTGTPAYASPEQLENRPLDGRSDLYSFGCLLYQLLTGRPPFTGSVVAVISQHLHAVPTPPTKLSPEIPPHLDALVRALLAKSPDARPTSATATRAMLRRDAPPPAPAEPPRPAPRRAARGLLGALVAACALLAVFVFRSPEPTPRRVVILPTRDVGTTVNSTVAWALASRLVEVVDRYREFRPISHAGTLAARLECLDSSEAVPDEAVAQRIAEHLAADTIAALSIGASGEDAITVAVHVFSAEDPTSGVSTMRERFSREDLDSSGPARLGVRLAQALARQWRFDALTDEAAGKEEPAVPFDAFQTYLHAQNYCVIGRYDRCEQLAASALERDPLNPLFHSLMACALSYQGRDSSAHEKIAMERGPKLPSRLQRLHAETALSWIEAEKARGRGDRERMQETARRMMEHYQELIDVWADPWGYLYAGATLQYFLEDYEGAKRMYARARAQGPRFYPGYFEAAKLLRGDGRSSADNLEAARVLWTFIECNPTSELIPVAREHAQDWRFLKPEGPLPCLRLAGR